MKRQKPAKTPSAKDLQTQIDALRDRTDRLEKRLGQYEKVASLGRKSWARWIFIVQAGEEGELCVFRAEPCQTVEDAYQIAEGYGLVYVGDVDDREGLGSPEKHNFESAAISMRWIVDREMKEIKKQ